MPVVDHPVHPRTVGGALYGCHNRAPFKASYIAPDRIYDAQPGPLPNSYRSVQTAIPHAMSTDCRYDMSLTDKKCADCIHRGSGEEYDKMIRSNGR
jgi:hypothetical protein